MIIMINRGAATTVIEPAELFGEVVHCTAELMQCIAWCIAELAQCTVSLQCQHSA